MIHVKGQLVCERIGCHETKNVKDFVRTQKESASWPDKKMPIALCEIHAIGRIEVLKSKLLNGKIIVKTMLTDELKLPPHIEFIQGTYFNKLNNRFIGEYKIKELCDRYWYEQENSATIETGDGIISYKKQFKKLDEKVDKRSKEYRSNIKEEPIIIPSAKDYPDPILETIIEDKIELPPFVIMLPNGDCYKNMLDNSFIHKDKIKEFSDNFWKNRPKAKNNKSIWNEVEITPEMFNEWESEIKDVAKNATTKPEDNTFTEDQKLAFKDKFDNNRKGITTSIVKELDERKEKGEDISDIELPDWIQKAIEPIEEKAITKDKQKQSVNIKFITPIESKEKAKSEISLVDIDEKTFINSPSVMFLLETHESLEIIISDFLKKWGCDFDRLKNERPIIKDSIDHEIWYEEYAAIICHLLFCHLPIYAKIEWISTFLNRSLKEVNYLLGIHYHRFYNFKKQSDLNDLYPDCYHDMSWEIAEYFSRYYKYEHSYKYREDKK